MNYARGKWKKVENWVKKRDFDVKKVEFWKGNCAKKSEKVNFSE